MCQPSGKVPGDEGTQRIYKPVFIYSPLESLHCGINPLILLTIICFVFTITTIRNKQNLISRIALERKGESHLILFIDLLRNLILNRISSETEIQLLGSFSFSKFLSPLKSILVSFMVARLFLCIRKGHRRQSPISLRRRKRGLKCIKNSSQF